MNSEKESPALQKDSSNKDSLELVATEHAPRVKTESKADGSYTEKVDNKEDQNNTKEHEHGCVLAIARKSAFDLLPPKIKERREEFLRIYNTEGQAQFSSTNEQEPRQESKNDLVNKDSLEKISARFYSRVQRVRQRMNTEKKKKRFSKQNVQALLVCALLFGLWVVWNEFFGPNEATLSLQDMQSRLPIVIDNNTKITKAYEKDDGLHLLIEKSGDEFTNLSEIEATKRKDAFLERARKLCRNELFSMYVRSGKVLHVSLSTDDGRPNRNISLDKCPASPYAG